MHTDIPGACVCRYPESYVWKNLPCLDGACVHQIQKMIVHMLHLMNITNKNTESDDSITMDAKVMKYIFVCGTCNKIR